MIEPPEIVQTDSARVCCDGASDIPGGAALGHPRIWIEIDERGYAECGYCDRRFVLRGAAADTSAGKSPERAHTDGPEVYRSSH